MKRLFSALLCGVMAFCLFSCEQEQDVPVTSVTITQSSAEMLIGETTQLSATVQPGNATEKTLTWTSSRQSVATVSSTGLVTAISEGESTITASAGGKSGTCKITVSKSDTSIATVKPDDATDKTVTWSSSNTAIAVVDNGKVQAVAEGSAIITAQSGGKTATCSVTVTK